MWTRRLALVVTLSLSPGAWADAPGSEKKPLPTGLLDAKAWLAAPTTPLQPGEIDRLVGDQLKLANLTPAPRTTDEQFVRRATLDLTGRLPMPADVTDFLADRSPTKREKLIDKLLDSDDYARHWALYWKDVIASRSTDFRAQLFARTFEGWMAEQLKANRGWGAVTRDLLTAGGALRSDEPGKNGQAYFLLSKTGADANVERAAETSRIFLGIQIQCAQCHDHPSDVWERHHFHEFAAYFARVKERPLRDGNKMVGLTLFALPFGEHQMPGKDDPKRGTAVAPKFLDGNGPGARLNDAARRKALADAVVSKDNPWFAGAFVNRVWGALMGQAFYTPIDDLGPQKEAVMPVVVARVAGAFRGSDYDVKGLLRAIMTSDTYQRQLRPGEAHDDHLLFAATNPVRMDANALWQTLIGTLGPLDGQRFGMAMAAGPFARFGGFEAAFKREFAYDPSTKPEEIEASVSQALVLMNSPAVNAKVQATGTNLLARILAAYPDDADALRVLYLRTLARRPTDREAARCREHLRSAASRAEGYEDLLWALINSTEYQTKR